MTEYVVVGALGVLLGGLLGYAYALNALSDEWERLNRHWSRLNDAQEWLNAHWDVLARSKNSEERE